MGRVVVRGAEARKKVIEILSSGGSLDDAARETGFGRNYCRQLGAKVGIRFERGKYKTTKKEKYRNIVDLYNSGNTPNQIAEKLGYKSTTSVYTALRQSGISLVRQYRVSAYEFRICPECGTVFYCHENHNKRFCCRSCEKAASHKRNDPKKRVRTYDAFVDKNITLAKVAKRDNNICYLCGGIVDWNDYKIVNGKKCSLGKYPSIDHVVALKNGGKHSWDNVRLAHIRCNAAKGVKTVG